MSCSEADEVGNQQEDATNLDRATRVLGIFVSHEQLLEQFARIHMRCSYSAGGM